jgi:hypothetical protein
VLARRLSSVAVLIALLAGPGTAQAFRLRTPQATIASNPADALLPDLPDAEEYDPATHCSKKRRRGMTLLQMWLEQRPRGVSWGVYRCEKWGKRSASLHAEGRAIDWHLDVTDAADKAEARSLIELLLAPDAAGNPRALARRMGVEEIIWDCSYWGAGMDQFRRYSACFTKRGRPRRHMDPTVGHRNHVHIGMTKRGAAAKTSFWAALT